MNKGREYNPNALDKNTLHGIEMTSHPTTQIYFKF